MLQYMCMAVCYLIKVIKTWFISGSKVRLSRTENLGLQIIFFQLNLHSELCFHDEKVLPILSNTHMHIHLICSSLLYNLHTFEAFAHRSLYITVMKIPCQWGLTFVKFSFIARMWQSLLKRQCVILHVPSAIWQK